MSNARNRSAVAVFAVLFPIAALADVTGTLTMASNTQASMDTGTTVSSGGDFLWNGTTLAPQGSVKALNATALTGIGGAAGYAQLTATLISSFAGLGSSSPLTGLAANTVVGYVTNGGNFGKLLVTAVAGGSITFQYTTYISTAITGVQNNYSYLVPGLPNYGIAPGTLFIIKGTNLASTNTVSALQSSAAPGIPTNLNGASISVTVGGVTVHPGMYYAIATQIAAVLPSNTPAGTGTITVTYSGTPSNSFSITVVPTALGLDSYYGTGSGLGVATDAVSGALITYTNSAKPGESIVLWGSGLGADTADSDTSFTTTPHAVTTPLTIYIGNTAVTPSYAGSSGYPGLNQINLTIPASVSTGCGVSVVGVSGNIVTNFIALPIASGGGVCTDSLLGYNGTQLLNAGGQTGTFTSAGVSIGQSTIPQAGETTAATASFNKFQNVTSGTGVSVTSLGSCSVTVSGIGGLPGNIPTIIGLDAGTITVTGPTGPQTLTPIANPLGSGPTGAYSAKLANSFLPPTGGTFTFAGTGGADVGAFSASISLSNILSWTNSSSITSVTRSNGVNLTWTGGVPNTYVFIGGSSSTNTASASFVCYAPVSAGQFTVPSYVLLALPVSANGSLGITNSAVPATFTATGLTSPGSVGASVSFTINSAYN